MLIFFAHDPKPGNGMEISPGRHLPTCRSCLTAGQKGGGLNMGLEAMLSIGQNPEKTRLDG